MEAEAMSPAKEHLRAARKKWEEAEQERLRWKEPWPKSKDVTKLVVEGPPDGKGRQSMTLYWWDGEGKRKGQVFFTNKEELLAGLKRDGKKVQVEGL